MQATRLRRIGRESGMLLVLACTFCAAFLAAMPAAPAAPVEFAEARRTRFTVSTPFTCSGLTPESLTQVVIDTATQLGRYCDTQNRSMARAGQKSCPSGTCFSELKPGDTPPGTLQITVTNGPSYGGLTSPVGVGGPSSPVGAGPSASSGRRFTITVGITLPLGDTPDLLTCVNPLSATVRDELLSKVIGLAVDHQAKMCSG